MVIGLTCEHLKQIYKFCGGAMDKKTEKEAFRFIRLEVDEKGITAYALDGYRLARMFSIPDTWEGEGSLFLPVVSVPKRATRCEISNENDTINLAFDDGTAYQTKLSDFVFPEVKYLEAHFKNRKEPMFSVWFNPQLLMDALKAVKENKKAVRLDFFSEKISPVILRTEGDFAENKLLVLPVKLPKS